MNFKLQLQTRKDHVTKIIINNKIIDKPKTKAKIRIS